MSSSSNSGNGAEVGFNGPISVIEAARSAPRWILTRMLLIVASIMLFSAQLLAIKGTSPNASTIATPSPPFRPSIIDVERRRIDAMLRSGHVDPADFSASFLERFSAAQVDYVIAGLRARLDAYESVAYTPSGFIARFAKGTDNIVIHLDDQQRIDDLSVSAPLVAASSLSDALRGLRTQPGTLAYVVEEENSERAALNASLRLAVGSAFKLAVLNALRHATARGSLRWTDVIPLATHWKSLPSGVLQAWPDGTPLTLANYAAEMISVSDNTAADALIRKLGQNALRPYADGNDPFITTREAFILKSKEAANLRARFLTANSATVRASVLKRVDAERLPTAQAVLGDPTLAIEWRYSVRKLCALMRRVADMPAMSINPGVADVPSFAHVAYKGGLDFGAVNLTTMLRTKRGTNVCFSATLNSPRADVDEAAFQSAYAVVLQQLAAL
jgi:beta-lactamase class A